MKTKTIRQTVVLKTNPAKVFEAFMDSRQHSKITGGKAKIGKRIGEKFSAYDGYCSGINLQIQKNKKIVQSWRANEWAEEHYSKATFSFKKTKRGTKLLFTQSGVPAQHYDSIKKGWIEYYWQPMKKFLDK